MYMGEVMDYGVITIPNRKLSRITRRNGRSIYGVLLPMSLNDLWDEIHEKRKRVTVIVKIQ